MVTLPKYLLPPSERVSDLLTSILHRVHKQSVDGALLPSRFNRHLLNAHLRLQAIEAPIEDPMLDFYGGVDGYRRVAHFQPVSGYHPAQSGDALTFEG